MEFVSLLLELALGVCWSGLWEKENGGRDHGGGGGGGDGGVDEQ